MYFAVFHNEKMALIAPYSVHSVNKHAILIRVKAIYEN